SLLSLLGLIRFRRRFRCDGLWRSPNGVAHAIALALDAIHQPPSPHKLCCKQAQSKQNHEPPRTGRHNHNDASRQRGKAKNDARDAADLLYGANDHEGFPAGANLRDAATSWQGRQGARQTNLSYHALRTRLGSSRRWLLLQYFVWSSRGGNQSGTT